MYSPIARVGLCAVLLSSVLVPSMSRADEPLAPSAPRSLSATRADRALVVRWVRPAETGTSAITGYTVTLRSLGVTKTYTASATASSLTVRSLVNGRSYAVSVLAKNAVGDSQTAGPVVMAPSTLVAKVPLAPRVVSVNVANQTFYVEYALGSSNGSTITSVQYSIDAGRTWTLATDNPIFVEGLVNNRNYSFQLRSRNYLGFSNPVSRTIRPTVLPNPISFQQPAGMALGSSGQTLVASAQSGNTVVESLTPSVCSVADGKVYAIATGSCQLQASNGGSDTHSASVPVIATFTVTKGKFVLSTDPLLSMGLNSTDQPVNVVAPGGTSEITSTTPSICSIVDEKIRALAVGICKIRVTNTGSESYDQPTPIDRMILITETEPAVRKTLLWSDEFSGNAGTTPSTSNWLIKTGNGCAPPDNNCGWGNNELQSYSSTGSTMDGSGILNIKANRGLSNNWTSGKIITYNKVSFSYGYLEARIKAPVGVGTWPAFWMLGSDSFTNLWPKCGEIDIMEGSGAFPSKAWATVHYATSSGTHLWKGNRGVNRPFNLSDDYHVYAIKWTPTAIQWYIDDVLFYTVNKADVGSNPWVFGPKSNGADPKFYAILNLAIGGNFVGNTVSPSLSSATMSVDYVRYYSIDGVGKVSFP